MKLTLLLNLAYLHLRRSEYTVALELLDRARRLAPDSPDVAKLSGWADYGLNRLPQAVEEWKRSQQLRPDPEVASALERAERDAQVETNFEEGVSAHFVLRYDGSAAPDLARAVLGELENDFESMVSLFDYTPAEPVAVILYTNRDFADITRAPAWVGAINDGRIRVPVQGVLTVTPALASDLRHELAHSFISQKTHGNCAIWLHEGIAQWAEGKRSKDDAAMLVDLYDHHDDPSLGALEKSWLAMPADVARISYGWSHGYRVSLSGEHVGCAPLESNGWLSAPFVCFACSSPLKWRRMRAIFWCAPKLRKKRTPHPRNWRGFLWPQSLERGGLSDRGCATCADQRPSLWARTVRRGIRHRLPRH